MQRNDQAAILIVDDKTEQRLTLEAVLSDLGHVVVADSGREALRQLLRREFAVILLDVNMPGMDGFETAELIRQRPNTRFTPIIFVTAFSDEMHVARGYALGAVDFILAPVVPDVLRTKVSVFLDLYRMTEQVRSQARAIERRADQLERLAKAAVAIHGTVSLDDMLEIVTDAARDVTGAHQALTATMLAPGWAHARRYASFSEKYADAQHGEGGPSALTLHVTSRNEAVRLDEPALAERTSFAEPAFGMPAPVAVLAVPLKARDGRNIGLMQVCEPRGPEFTAFDEMILTQLAQMTAIAIENTLYYEVREANRVKDEFLATLSHELRTPMNAVLGWSVLLRRGDLSEEEFGHGLEVIERNVKVQSRLLEDLLDVSRITAGKLKIEMRRSSLGQVLQAAIEAVRGAAEAKGVALSFECRTHDDVAAIDPDRLQQVAWNLLTNGIKFTRPGGRVEVVLERRESRFVIRTSDTGIGIAADFLPHVFDRFRQAESRSRRPHGGLGIGLTIARHLVEMHGGTIQVESAGENRGTTFVVELPAPEAELRAEPAAPSQAAGVVDLQNVSILVVDDEKDARELLTRVLEHQRATVRAVGSANEALGALGKGGVDVLVSDIAMPGADGYDLIEAVRRLDGPLAAVPAIAITAFARDEDRARAMAAGFQMHLAKPIDPVEVVRAVGRLAGRLGGGSPGPNGVLAGGAGGAKASRRTRGKDEVGAT